jgi:hypothetical protein
MKLFRSRVNITIGTYCKYYTDNLTATEFVENIIMYRCLIS